MKKFLVVLAIGAFVASCNNSADTAASKVDSAASAVVDSAKSTLESAKAKVDSTAKAVVDSAKAKVDSLKKLFDLFSYGKQSLEAVLFPGGLFSIDPCHTM